MNFGRNPFKFTEQDCDEFTATNNRTPKGMNFVEKHTPCGTSGTGITLSDLEERKTKYTHDVPKITMLCDPKDVNPENFTNFTLDKYSKKSEKKLNNKFNSPWNLPDDCEERLINNCGEFVKAAGFSTTTDKKKEYHLQFDAISKHTTSAIVYDTKEKIVYEEKGRLRQTFGCHTSVSPTSKQLRGTLVPIHVHGLEPGENYSNVRCKRCDQIKELVYGSELCASCHHDVHCCKNQ